MPKIKFTDSALKKLKVSTERKKILYLDSEESGLALEVRSSGNKTYYYRYNSDGKTYQKKIASFEAISVDEARRVVKELKVDKERKTPICINDTPSDTNQSMSLRRFWDEHYCSYIKVTHKSYDTCIGFFKNHILPHFGNRPMGEITNKELAKHQTDLVTIYHLQKSTANKFVRYLSPMYKKAIEWEIPNVTLNPMIGLKEYRVAQGIENFLTHDEIHRLLGVADEYICSIDMGKLLRFYLFTGARKNELVCARWQDIDLENKVWTIPLSKSGKNRKVPISNELEKLIVSLPKISEYLFPSSLTNEKMGNFFKHWKRIRTRANLPHIRLHDLRHTFASILVNHNVSIYQVQKILGHSSVNMTMRYAHLSNKALYDAVSVVDNVVNC